MIPAAPWEEMSSGLTLLGEQLSEIALTPAMIEAGLELPGDPGRISAQSVLSQKLLADAANLRQGAPNGSGGSSSADGLGNRGNILLLDPSTSDAVAASRIAELEARFHRVETALGDMSTFRQAVAAAVSGDGAEGSAAGPRSGSRGSVGASEDILSSVDNDAKGAPGGSFPGGLLGIVSALEKRVELLTPGKLDLVGKKWPFCRPS